MFMNTMRPLNCWWTRASVFRARRPTIDDAKLRGDTCKNECSDLAYALKNKNGFP